MSEDKPNIKRLEYAATMLLEMLPPQIRDLAIELADLQYHCPRWHVVAGAVLRLSEEGRMADFSTEPHWDSDTIEREPSTCTLCGSGFMPDRLGQRFCSNECGQKFNLGLKKEDNLGDAPKPNISTLTDLPSDHPDSPSVGAPSMEELMRESAEIALAEITR